MKLIHTSDWHLGQTFHGFSRAAEHQRFLDWLIDCIAERAADALLIAGDIFDTSNPSADAQAQFYRFLSALKQRCPQLDVVIIAGNHDSPGRLEAPNPLLDAMGIQIVGQLNADADESARVLIPLRNSQGRVAAWCLAIPFLRPADVRSISGSADPYLSGVVETYQRYISAAEQRREPGQALIAMGHCHLQGGAPSPDSERRLLIGGAEALDASMFPPALSYVALGHLHLAQEVDQQSRLRYCGSPLALSFAELSYPHQVLEVELAGESLLSVNSISVPRAVPLLRVPAQAQPWELVLAELQALKVQPPQSEDLRAFLEVQVLQDRPLPQLRSHVEAAVAQLPLRLAKISARREMPPASDAAGAPQAEMPQLDPEFLVDAYYQELYNTPMPDDLKQALRELLLAPTEPR